MYELTTARRRAGNHPFLETASGHRCNAWRYHPGSGVECVHGFVVWPHELGLARLRAERIDDLPAAA